MLRIPAGTDEALRSAPTLLDFSRLTTDHGAVSAALDSVARDLRNLWACTLASGNVCEIEGIVEASHAVHRAAATLREDILIPSR